MESTELTTFFSQWTYDVLGLPYLVPPCPLLEDSKFALMVKQPALFVTKNRADFRMTADSVVKVPQMAESITEGTLKQFSKRNNLTCPSSIKSS